MKISLLLTLFCILLILLLPNYSCSVQIEAEWHKIFDYQDLEYGNCVQQTSDGGYIVIGTTSTFQYMKGDVWFIKTDSKGNEVWNKTFGGEDDDGGSCVQQTSDGGYIIAGFAGEKSTKGYGETSDVWLIKTGSEGNMIWNRTFDGRDADGGSHVQQTNDGGYIIVGYTGGTGWASVCDVWLIKTDAEGNEVWNKTFGGKDHDAGNCVQQTSDGGYVVVGGTSSYGADGGDVWLIKTDPEGNELWNKTFGGEGHDAGSCVQQTSDGGYIVVGNLGNWHPEYGDRGVFDVWLIKTDPEGNELWNKTFGGEDDDDFGYCVQQTSDGGYVVVGGTSSYGADGGDVWLIKTDPEGNELWNKTFGGSRYDFGSDVKETSDGGYIITGQYAARGPLLGCLRQQTSDRNLWLIKYVNTQ